MKQSYSFILSFILFMAATSANAQFSYISPLPGSKMHNKQTNIILKNGGFIDASSVNNNLISITGSKSGSHTSRIVLSDDQKTIVAYPQPMLEAGETVTVNVNDGLRRKDGTTIHGTTFQFETHQEWTPEQQAVINTTTDVEHQSEWGDEYKKDDGGGTRLNCVGIVPFQLTSTANAYDAKAFYYNFYTSNPTCWARTIIDNNGDSLYADFNNSQGVCFGINKNGYLTYHDAVSLKWYMADSSYNVIDSFQMGNGYLADEHDFLVFPDGHSFLFAYDTQPYDLSPWGGSATGNAIGCVIQELDVDHNVIFQWRTWDYMSIGDAIYWQQSSIGNNVAFDWVHGNSMEQQNDSSLLVSFRHLCEVTKINLNTGDMVWRMGGENNQFTFVNDSDEYHAADGHTYYFSGQHDVKILPNGHLTMFNNDNNMAPVRSGGKEYVLDEVNKTATQVWRYVHPSVNGQNMVCNAMGSVQRLPNGNSFISWGLIASPFTNPEMPKISEVDASGNIVWELRWTPPDSTILYATYRAFKYDWERCNLLADSSLHEDSIGIFSAILSWGDNSKFSGYILQYKKCNDIDWISVPLDTNYFDLQGLSSATCYDWRVQSICSIYNDTSSYSSTHVFTTDLGTGVSSLINPISTLSVYPNPTPGESEITFTISADQQVAFTVYNLLGGIVKTEILNAHSGTNQIKADFGSLAAGIYNLEIKAGSQTLHHRLVVN